ncbi:MAG: MurR/RpiR family transcriptional regulator [Ignavibacteria bacterium]|nr:MurR/RpiR family transcriptional regulator [Ignavibacteria bacterium]
MTNYKKLKARIQQQYDSLPALHKKIADYYLENFESIPFMTAQQMAKATSTNDAAVVRFAQKIGFSGFSELRDQIGQSLQKRFKDESLFPLINPAQLNDNMLTSVANQDITNINETVRLNEKESFEKVVELISKSDRVFTVGLGISYLLANIISYQVNQIGISSQTFNNNQSTFMEQVLFMNPNDLLIALSLPPYSKDTIETVKFAKERKIKVVSFTNKKSSPIALHSDATMIIKSENMLFTNSFAAISVLINAIVTECALKNEVKSTKWLTQLKNVTKLQRNTLE